MAKERDPSLDPISVEDQKAMLEGIGDEGIPDYVVMEDEKPERFKEMMGEGTKEDLLMQSLEGLPDRILDTFRDG